MSILKWKVCQKNIQFMPKDFDNIKYLLIAACEVKKNVLSIPIKSRAVKVMTEILIHGFIYIFGPSELLIVDKDY